MPRDKQNAAALRDEIIFTALDEVSRYRPLATPESELMELAMHRLGLAPGQQSPAEQMRQRMQLLAKRNALHQRDVAICNLLGKIQHLRQLDRHETTLMAGAMHRLGLTHDKWHWTPEEDELVLRLLRNRARRKRPKLPFTTNGEVERLAVELGRSYWATQRRIERLRNGRGKMFKREGGNGSLDSADGRQDCNDKNPVDDRAATVPQAAARPGSQMGTDQ